MQHCCSANWNSLLRVLPPAWPTCLATKYRVASWSDVLRKVDASSTFCNKFQFCCSYYHWSFNLSRNKFDFNACDWLSAKRGYGSNYKKKTWRTQRTERTEKTSFLLFWISGDTFPNKKQNCSLVMRKNSLYATTSPTSSSLITELMKHAPLLSPRNPLPHIHFPISFSRPFPFVLAVQKAQTESSKRSLPTEKELSSRLLCLHTTDQSYAQDSANLQQYVLLRNKLVTQVVIRATESFNLHCNNVARQVEVKCCPYYRTLNSCQQSCLREKAKIIIALYVSVTDIF